MTEEKKFSNQELVIERLQTMEVREDDLIILRCSREIMDDEREAFEAVVSHLRKRFPGVMVLLIGADWDISLYRKVGEGEKDGLRSVRKRDDP